MKTLFVTSRSFGPPEVLEFKESQVDDLKDDEFLVEGQYASVSTADVRIRSKNVPKGFGLIMGLIFGFRQPKFESLGTDYSGQVIQVGKSVQGIKVGDRIVADLGMSLNGYRTLRKFRSKDVWIKIPDEVESDRAVAAVFGGITALVFLRDKLKVNIHDKILVIGAGGAVGSSAVQIATFFGANVSAVCSSDKAKVVKNLGASEVFDYKSQDWQNQGQDFDVVLDCVGVLDVSSSKKLLKADGRIGFVVADLFLNLKCPIASMVSSNRFVSGAVQGTKADLQFLMDLIRQGEFEPLIGKKYPFLQVIEAHREVERGHKLGSIVLEISTSRQYQLS